MDDLIERLRVEPTASQFLRIGDLVESLIVERKEAADRIAALAELERDELRAGPDGPKEMNPRAWLVTKQGMTGDLYEALAWDNGGKPLGVSVSTPTPLYEGEALRAKLTKLGDLLAFIHRDGGHYQAEHGTAKAVEDAIRIVAERNAKLDEYERAPTVARVIFEDHAREVCNTIPREHLPPVGTELIARPTKED